MAVSERFSSSTPPNQKCKRYVWKYIKLLFYIAKLVPKYSNLNILPVKIEILLLQEIKKIKI